jgi:hypothetical protein
MPGGYQQRLPTHLADEAIGKFVFRWRVWQKFSGQTERRGIANRRRRIAAHRRRHCPRHGNERRHGQQCDG